MAGKRWIRQTRTAIGPEFAYAEGSERQVSHDEAEALINADAAIAIEGPGGRALSSSDLEKPRRRPAKGPGGSEETAAVEPRSETR